MTETWTGPPQPDFSQTFMAMSELVQDATKLIHVRIANQSEVTHEGVAAVITPIFEVIEEDYYLDPETNLPLESRSVQPRGRLWRTSAPMQKEEGTLDELKQRSWVHYVDEEASWESLPGRSLESKFWLGRTFVRHAPDAGELGKVLAAVFSLDAAIPGDHRSGKVTAIVQNALVRSTGLIYDEESARAFMEPVAQVFETAQPEIQEKIMERVSNGLIKMLRSTMIGEYTETQVRHIPKEAIVDAIELYDKAGLIRDSFWNSAALLTGAAAKVPAFLPLLHAKLSGPDGERLIAGLDSPTHVAREYITKVFQQYANDPTRDTKVAEGIVRRISSRAQYEGPTIDLEKLVREANVLGNSYNVLIDQRQGTESEKYEMLPPVLDNDVVFLGDAFLRLASIMRRRDTSEAMRGAQLDQDVMHADILSILLADLPASTRISEADLRVRFPEMSPERRRALRQRLSKIGLPLGETVERPEAE